MASSWLSVVLVHKRKAKTRERNAKAALLVPVL